MGAVAIRYDKRAVLIKVIVENGPLGQTETEVRETKACAVQNVSFDEQSAVYGQTTTSGLKLHFRSHVEGYERVEYQGKTYDIKMPRHYRGATVLYVSRNSHYG